MSSPTRSHEQADRNAAEAPARPRAPTSRRSSPMTTCANGSTRPSKLGEVKRGEGAVLAAGHRHGVRASALHADTAPCVVFEDVPGTLKGSRVLVNFFGGKRKNMTLGFPTELSQDRAERRLPQPLTWRPMKRIPPQIRRRRPGVRERHAPATTSTSPTSRRRSGTPSDGGRYIGTGSFNVTRDPDEGWINCGTYRVMVHDAKTRRLLHLARQARPHACATSTRRAASRCRSRSSCGGDPMTFLMACSEVPYGVCEYEVVGGMRGKPVEVVKAPVTGLPIPANAEIVHRGLRRSPATSASKARSASGPATTPATLRARAGARRQGDLPPQRSDPARLRAAAAARRDRAATARSCARRCCARTSHKAGVPDVDGGLGARGRQLRGCCSRVAIKQRYPGHAKQAGHIAAMCHVGAYCGRYVIVVDDDIDVSNLKEVMWALLTRSDPGDLDRHHHATPGRRRSIRASSPSARRAATTPTAAPIIDACRPFHWRDQFPRGERALAGGAPHARRRSSATCSRIDRPEWLNLPRRTFRAGVEGCEGCACTKAIFVRLL